MTNSQYAKKCVLFRARLCGRSILATDGVTRGTVIDVHAAVRRRGVWMRCVDESGAVWHRYRQF